MIGVLTDLMSIRPETIKAMDFFKIDNRLLDRTDLKAELKTALRKGENFQIGPGKISPSQGTGAYRMMGQVIRTEDDLPYSILLRFAKER